MFDPGPAHRTLLVLLPPVHNAVHAEGVAAVEGSSRDVDLHADGALEVSVCQAND